MSGRAVAGAVLLALAGACAAPAPTADAARPEADARSAPRDPCSSTALTNAVRTTYGRSVEGRPLDAWVVGEGGPTLALLATIHGDEDAGTPLLERLLRELDADPARAGGWRVVVVPLVNPDGRAAGRRGNANGVDLNRNFPAANQDEARRGGQRPLSEPEADALAALLRFHAPERVVSIHQPLACVDHDGPAEALAQRIADACGLPVRKLGARPGSLGTWLGVERGVAVVTLELPRRPEPDPDALWARYGPALWAALDVP